MIVFWIIVFGICVLPVLHSYVLYPFILKLKAANKEPIWDSNARISTYRKVSILMAAYNEESVLEEKINSILESDYPHENIQILVGSDNSTDRTNEIMVDFEKKYPNIIKFFHYTERQGKGNIINKLYNESIGEILILTDANVIFDVKTIKELVKCFENDKIGLADTNMINKGMKKAGISYQEKAYISREVLIKNREGKIWGTMMGPFGGCFAVRKELYESVPVNFLVDDFYINMKIYEKGYLAVNNLNAKVYEDVSNDLSIEFRRKIRIATGNFQNLETFARLIFSPIKGLGFSFLSHKVLRWISPFLLIDSLLALSMLGFSHNILLFEVLFYLQLFSMLIPFIDICLRKLKIHIVLLRFITHFYAMNLALFIGFFKYLKGVKSNVWEPTKRNQ